MHFFIVTRREHPVTGDQRGLRVICGEKRVFIAEVVWEEAGSKRQ